MIRLQWMTLLSLVIFASRMHSCNRSYDRRQTQEHDTWGRGHFQGSLWWKEDSSKLSTTWPNETLSYMQNSLRTALFIVQKSLIARGSTNGENCNTATHIFKRPNQAGNFILLVRRYLWVPPGVTTFNTDEFRKRLYLDDGLCKYFRFNNCVDSVNFLNLMCLYR